LSLLTVIDAADAIVGELAKARGLPEQMALLARVFEGAAVMGVDAWSKCVQRYPYQVIEAYSRIGASVSEAVRALWKAQKDLPESARGVLRKVAESFLFPDLEKVIPLWTRSAALKGTLLEIAARADGAESRAESYRKLRVHVEKNDLTIYDDATLKELGVSTTRTGMGGACLAVCLWFAVVAACMFLFNLLQPSLSSVVTVTWTEETKKNVGVGTFLVVPLFVTIVIYGSISRMLRTRSRIQAIDTGIKAKQAEAQKIRNEMIPVMQELANVAKNLRSHADQELWAIATPGWYSEWSSESPS
jgi:hypothetical protein